MNWKYGSLKTNMKRYEHSIMPCGIDYCHIFDFQTLAF
jgi:endonuclease IV